MINAMTPLSPEMGKIKHVVVVGNILLLSPVEVLNFFQASLRNCKHCNHNCEDHSSFDFISAVHI